MKKSEKILAGFFILIFLISASEFTDLFNFEESKDDFYNSIGEVIANELNKFIATLMFLIISFTFMSIRLHIIFKNVYEKSGYARPGSLSRLSIILLVVYIFALVTTTVSNIGPMLFGGVLSLWLFDLTQNQMIERK